MGDLKKDSTSPAPKRSKANDSGDDEGGWFPKTTNWESAVDQIDHIDRDGKTGSLTAFIRWKDKTKPNTRVSMSRIYTHCPIAMLKFYELHLYDPNSVPVRSLLTCVQEVHRKFMKANALIKIRGML